MLWGEDLLICDERMDEGGLACWLYIGFSGICVRCRRSNSLFAVEAQRIRFLNHRHTLLLGS